MGLIKLDIGTFDNNLKKVDEAEKNLHFKVKQSFESKNTITLQHLLQTIEVTNRDIETFKEQTKDTESSLAKIKEKFVETDNYVKNNVLSK